MGLHDDYTAAGQAVLAAADDELAQLRGDVEALQDDLTDSQNARDDLTRRGQVHAPHDDAPTPASRRGWGRFVVPSATESLPQGGVRLTLWREPHTL